MTRKGLLMLVLTVVAAGGVFAQTGFASMPKNTVTVDVGPTILGVAFGQAGNIAGNLAGDTVMPDLNSSGFGIAAQYERQLLSQLGVAARGAYIGLNLGTTMDSEEDGGTLRATVDLGLKAISVEGHVRFYPFAGRTFFLGGMLGYGNLALNVSGNITGTYQGESESESFSFNAPRNYAKLGARLGWRIDFGRPGGFVFEPSFGYDHAIGLGETFGKRLQDDIGDLSDSDIASVLDDAFKILENYVFVGGPRLTLSFGWRF